MTTLAVATSVLSAVTLAAAVDAGKLVGRRVLLVANDAVIPEVTPGVSSLDRFSAIAGRFDAVVDINSAIAPVHPLALRSSTPAARALRSVVIEAAGGDITRIAAPECGSEPWLAVVAAFPSVPVDVIVDRLAGYGTAPSAVPGAAAARLDRVLYPAIVPGTVPHLGLASGMTPVELEGGSLRKVYSELSGGAEATDRDEVLILGLGRDVRRVVPAALEGSLMRDMVTTAAEAGFSAVTVVPHPSGPPGHGTYMAAHARDLGIEFHYRHTSVPLELLLERARPRAVIGVGSTALATASSLYEIRAAAVGSAEVAARVPSVNDPLLVAVALAWGLAPALTEAVEPDRSSHFQQLLDLTCRAADSTRPSTPHASAIGDDAQFAEVRGWIESIAAGHRAQRGAAATASTLGLARSCPRLLARLRTAGRMMSGLWAVTRM